MHKQGHLKLPQQGSWQGQVTMFPFQRVHRQRAHLYVVAIASNDLRNLCKEAGSIQAVNGEIEGLHVSFTVIKHISPSRRDPLDAGAAHTCKYTVQMPYTVTKLD